MTWNKVQLLAKLCADSKSLTQAKLLNGSIIILGFQDHVELRRNLFKLYFSCRSYDYAESVLEVAGKPLKIVWWNSLMSTYCKNVRYSKTLDLFAKLLKNPLMEPDHFSYSSTLKACGALGRVKDGSALHARLIKSQMLAGTVVASSLSGMYGKCRMLTECLQVFDEIPKKDVSSWNEVISSFYHNGEAEQALTIFEKMKKSGFIPSSETVTTAICACARLLDVKRGMQIHEDLEKDRIVSDHYISSALVNLYAKCGYLEKCKEVFEVMPVKTVAAWNSIISGFSEQLSNGECFKLFVRMILEGNAPNLTTLTIMLSACSTLSELHYGKFVHGLVIKSRWEVDAFINSALIDLYFNCGQPQSAENVFQSLAYPDVACWNAMIHGYAQVGLSSIALDTYYRMKAASVKPNAITYASVLPACSKSASLEKGREIHISIVEDGLENDAVIRGALLDMYGKCGAVDQANDIFLKAT